MLPCRNPTARERSITHTRFSLLIRTNPTRLPSRKCAAPIRSHLRMARQSRSRCSTLYQDRAHIRGNKVGFTVVEPIVVNGLLVVPKDGIAWGTVAKSEGGRHLSRSGEVRINIEGMWLADGGKCPLATEETYRGAKRSRKGNTAVVAGDVFTGGLLGAPPRPGRNRTRRNQSYGPRCGKIILDPAQFEPSGSSPPIQASSPVVSGLSVISFQNQSGADAVVRLLGPSTQVLTVVNGQSFGAPVAAGDYFVVVRYGKSDSEYLFQKAGPIPVTEPSGKHSVVHITLQRPAADDPKAREEFYKGQ